MGSDTLVGHNITFDLGFLRTESGKFIPNDTIDTCTMSRRCLVQGRELNAASNGKSRKTVQAEERGIPIISEEDFISKLREVLHAEE